MINFFKKLFGSKPVETPVPYKVEEPVAESKPKRKTAAEKKPAGATKTVRKPRAKKEVK